MIEMDNKQERQMLKLQKVQVDKWSITDQIALDITDYRDYSCYMSYFL